MYVCVHTYICASHAISYCPQFCLLKGLEKNDTLVAMKIPKANILVCKCCFSLKGTRAPLKNG